MGCNPDFLQRLYSSSVSERLKTAQRLFDQFSGQLKNNKALTDGLEQLDLLARELSAHMNAMDMGRQCVLCASEEGGGCCSLYMAGETDTVQILMNLLVGIDVKKVRDDGFECCFLGSEGCLFSFKPMFCLNYNCTRIKENCDKTVMQELERLSGKLLRQQYHVEQMILAIICDR